MNARQLLADCDKAVAIAARSIEHRYTVPQISTDERAEYAAELACRLVAENNGRTPQGIRTLNYLVQRARGIIIGDASRRTVSYDETETAKYVASPSLPEPARADPRLTGPLSVPAEAEAIAKRLSLTETGRRALIAAIVPATRQEWTDYYGYASVATWKQTAKRGRAEVRQLGADAVREALEPESDYLADFDTEVAEIYSA